MPAHRRQLLVSFRRHLWRSRLARLYVHKQRRLQRCPVGSALHRDATGLSLSNTGCKLIGIAPHLPLTGGDSGLIGAACCGRLASGNARRDFVDASRHQLLTGDDQVQALPHRVEVAQYRVELIGVGDGWRSDRVGSFLHQ
jgi:hypothetical protein